MYNKEAMDMFSLAPIVTKMASNVLNSVLPGLTGQMGGKFSLLGNLQMIDLPNHLPPSTYLLFLFIALDRKDKACEREGKMFTTSISFLKLILLTLK